ncbi:MAG: ogr/Delta-like zinc finger family protein [Pseudomonadota bacterium]|jgi:hypothetical protein
MSRGYQRRANRLTIECPHCAEPSNVRTSKTITAMYREYYYQCPNIDCGHTWKASLSFIHTISPSACPRMDLDLPQAPKHPPANDRKPRTKPVTPRDNANDDSVQGEEAVSETTHLAASPG